MRKRTGFTWHFSCRFLPRFIANWARSIPTNRMTNHPSQGATMMNRVGFGTLLMCTLLIGCQPLDTKQYKEVNLNDQFTYSENHRSTPAEYHPDQWVIAIASIVSANESFSAYDELIQYIGLKLGQPTRAVYTKDYSEVYTLFKEHKVDAAFICSGLYIIGKKHQLMELLTVPVVNGAPTYQAYIIVPRTSSIQQFEELDQKTFAFTDRLSLTGCFYPLYGHQQPLTFWKKVIFTGNHDASIELVNRGIIDGASVDGLVFEDIARNDPSRVQNIRILEKSEPFGIPPVVVHPNVGKTNKRLLQQVFLQMDHDSTGQNILRKIHIDHFQLPDETLYETLESMVPDSIIP
ncbi:MAG: hypothetical protein D6675_07290 [Gemmatimonadetes bacterium]|nr:MAG: hypothetical protein D6675_07290 [Gemmatimonadota bacterium]